VKLSNEGNFFLSLLELAEDEFRPEEEEDECEERDPEWSFEE
jgi:hypothetical protein